MPTTLDTPLEVARTITLTGREVRFYQDHGYLCVPGFVKSEHVAALREEVFAVLEANGVSRALLGKANSAADRLRQCSQYLRGSKLDRMINGPRTRRVIEQLIGGKAHVYMPFTAVKAGGGGGTFDYHQDNNYTRHEPAVGSINLWVALVDMTPENGCLQIIPDSHKLGQLESRDSDHGDSHQKLDIDENDLLPIRMRAGDAVAFTRWTVHGSGANHTDEPRVAYALQYHRADVKFFDKRDDQWKLLADTPRWQVGPVEKLGAQ